MATLILRTVKGTPLTLAEVDSNFTELETDITTLATSVTNHVGGTGAAHGLATTLTAGFMSTTDKDNLNKIVAGTTGVSVAITDDNTTNATRYPTFVSATNGTTSSIYVASADLSFNPSSGQLSAVSFNSTSDERLKTDIEPITDALNTIEKISGKTYKLVSNNINSAGVIAQELQAVLPNSVSDRGDGFLSVNYDSIIPYLIEAVKELSISNQELQKEIEILKSK
jgi:hypothetical protein